MMLDTVKHHHIGVIVAHLYVEMYIKIPVGVKIAAILVILVRCFLPFRRHPIA
jgi:hypothetical protein